MGYHKLTPQEFYRLERGDVIYQSLGPKKIKLSVVTLPSQVPFATVEHLSSDYGRERDSDVPKDYVSVGTDRYWYVGYELSEWFVEKE